MLACVTLGSVGQTIAFSCAVCAQNDFQSASFPGWLEDGGGGGSGCSVREDGLGRGLRRRQSNRPRACVEAVYHEARMTNLVPESGKTKTRLEWIGKACTAQLATRWSECAATRIGTGTDSCRTQMQIPLLGLVLMLGTLQVWSAGKNAC